MLAFPRRLLTRISDHQTGLVAAGCAFYGTLALIPALSTLVSLYGLAFDPARAESQLDTLRDLLPDDAHSLIAEQVHRLVAQPQGTLGLSFGASLAATFWSASSGTKAMLSALNLAAGTPETRGIIRFQATGLALTLGTMLAGIVAVALLVALPAAIGFAGLARHAGRLVDAASFGVLLLFVATLLATLYRVGPATAPARVIPGALAGTLLWLAASWVFSWAAEGVMALGATYGPLATAAALMLWFWVSAYATLVGAEINAILAGPD